MEREKKVEGSWPGAFVRTFSHENVLSSFDQHSMCNIRVPDFLFACAGGCRWLWQLMQTLDY
jgi:hypothetical protein